MNPTELLQNKWKKDGIDSVVVRVPPQPNYLPEASWVIDISMPHNVTISIWERGEFRFHKGFKSEQGAVDYLKKLNSRKPSMGSPLTPEEYKRALSRAKEVTEEVKQMVAEAKKQQEKPKI